jgi:hypothetical protein
LDNYLGHYAGELQKHASAAPDHSTTWVPSDGSPVTSLVPVQSGLLEIFPVAPYPEASFANGTSAYAQLGVYVCTLQELVDNPASLSRPGSRAFASAIFARLEALHSKFGDGLTVAPMQTAINQPFMLDQQWIDTTWRQPLSNVITTKWPDGPRKAFILGSMIAQLAYNAAVLKDADADTEFRGVLSSLPRWVGMSQKTVADITALQKVPYIAKGGKWEDINAAATAATRDIVAEK